MARYIIAGFSIAFLFSLSVVVAQSGDCTVDEHGIIRWPDGIEVKGFGVNYTMPFAHAYRSAIKMGIDPYQQIDEDVYHFSRLGFDLFRVHVWDTEISDTLGNLLENEHLDCFDYLLKRLDERDINYILTPIAFWGGGWPEPDQKTPGFSYKYGKDGCLIEEDAIKAQENFLTQFMQHTNHYTGIAYKDDPRLIAVEVSNEPHHREEPEVVKQFVERMVSAIKKAPCDKPIFYNASHSIHLADQYFKGGAQGGTFQWYPTGLGYQKELSGNFLPNVDNYGIPFQKIMDNYQVARIVYEFDGADVNKSYIYPAMARSFRKAGIQLATHFSYDPTFLGPYNTEYNTHYMNLAYTPHKAIALMISGEIFHQLPLWKDYGKYPDNTSFGPFLVDYQNDLAILNDGEKFYYSNDTGITPLDPSKLKHIAGNGNSPLVQYDGTGAYFLDKLEEGVWRLEVMPDVLLLRDPFGKNSFDKNLSAIQWNERKMKISLDDIGEEFEIIGLSKEHFDQFKNKKSSFSITPGAYLLTKSGTQHDWTSESVWNNIKIKEFSAPASNIDKTLLINDSPQSFISNTNNDSSSCSLLLKLISPDEIKKVIFRGHFRKNWISYVDTLHFTGGFTWEMTIPKSFIQEGFLDYYISVYTDKDTLTFPSGRSGEPFEWDFAHNEAYCITVHSFQSAIVLFDALNDHDKLRYSRWPDQLDLRPLDNNYESALSVEVDQLFKNDPENQNATPIYDFTLRHFLDRIPEYQKHQIKTKKSLAIKLKSNKKDKKTYPIQLALVDQKGKSFGYLLDVHKDWMEYHIPLDELKEVPTVLMPRPYPTFLPYYFDHDMDHELDLENIRGIQLSIGPGLGQNDLKSSYGISLAWIKLE